MKLKTKILIVDDDTDDREIVKDAFETLNQDFEYEFLENGDRLLEYLTQNWEGQSFLILLDLNMPGKDGRESLKEIKTDERFCHIPTIVFTTSSSLRDKQMSYKLGANCFITKPDTFNKLTELADNISKLWLQ
jgi:CheY-like chemotaxis protein